MKTKKKGQRRVTKNSHTTTGISAARSSSSSSSIDRLTINQQCILTWKRWVHAQFSVWSSCRRRQCCSSTRAIDYGPRDRLPCYYCYVQGCVVWLCNGHSHEGCLDVASLVGSISCLLSAGYLLVTEGGGLGRSCSFRQAITPASHYKGENFW